MGEPVDGGRTLARLGLPYVDRSYAAAVIRLEACFRRWPELRREPTSAPWSSSVTRHSETRSVAAGRILAWACHAGLKVRHRTWRREPSLHKGWKSQGSRLQLQIASSDASDGSSRPLQSLAACAAPANVSKRGFARDPSFQGMHFGWP